MWLFKLTSFEMPQKKRKAKKRLWRDAGIAFIPACPTTVPWMAITGPRHQAVEETLPSYSIWLFGRLNRQLPWWLWSCLWVCHRVWLLMEDLDSCPRFHFAIFLLYLLGIRRFSLFHKQMLPSEAWWLFPLTQLYLGKYFLSTSYIPYRSRKIGKRPGISKPSFLLHTPPAERIRN